MAEKYIVQGRSFGSDTIVSYHEDGGCTVLVKMIERLKRWDADWEEKVVSTECTDDDFEKAYLTAMNATLEKLHDAIEAGGADSLFGKIEVSGNAELEE